MDATVKITPLDPPDSTNWKVSHGFNSGSEPKDYPHVKLSKDSGAQVITFNIQGNNGTTFNKADPLWVQEGSKPTQKPGAGADKGQIGAFKVMPGDKQLVVLDWNDAAGTFYYRLNVDGGHGPLDPIIDNGGGVKPGLMTYSQYSADIFVALVAFVLGFLACRFLAPRRAWSRPAARSSTSEKLDR